MDACAAQQAAQDRARQLSWSEHAVLSGGTPPLLSAHKKARDFPGLFYALIAFFLHFYTHHMEEFKSYPFFDNFFRNQCDIPRKGNVIFHELEFNIDSNSFFNLACMFFRLIFSWDK